MCFYSVCSNCKMMIILCDPFNDRYGDFFFAQPVFSAYLSVVLLNTSHNFRDMEHKFGGGVEKNAPNRNLTGLFFFIQACNSLICHSFICLSSKSSFRSDLPCVRGDYRLKMSTLKSFTSSSDDTASL